MIEPEPIEGLNTRIPKGARDAVAQVIEMADVDSVVLLFTRHRKRKTSAYLAHWGNDLLWKALLEHVAQLVLELADDGEEDEVE